jgi:hypothetical protein
MRRNYLEVTFRKGKALAAYRYLPRKNGAKSTRTEEQAKGILVDHSDDGEPIGVEVTEPHQVSLEAINEVLQNLGHSPIQPEDIAPMKAA